MTEQLREYTDAELDAENVKAIGQLMVYCNDPSSPWHEMAVEYMRPRAVMFADLSGADSDRDIDPSLT